MDVSAGALRVTAAPGETNAVDIGPGLVVADSGAPLTLGPGCVPQGLDALCTGATRVEADLGDGDDALTVTAPLPADLNGDEGNDALTAVAAVATLEGGDGDDTLTAASGADVLSGGPGYDTLSGGEGDDRIDGGTGGDSADGGGGRGLDRPARPGHGHGDLRRRPRHRARRGARPARLRLRARGLRPTRERRAPAPDHRRRAVRADSGPVMGARGPAHPARRALPDPPLPRAGRRRVRDDRTRAARGASARPGRGPLPGPRRQLARGRAPGQVGRAAPEPHPAAVQVGGLESAIQTTATPGTAASAAAARPTCTSRGTTRPASRATRCARSGSSTCAPRPSRRTSSPG